MNNFKKILSIGLLVALLFNLPSSVSAETKAETTITEKTDTTGDTRPETANEIIPGFIPRFELGFNSVEIEKSLVERLERNTAFALEIKETFALSNMGTFWGYLIYDTYSFKNGDLYYYLKYTPLSTEAGEISLNIPFKAETADIRMIEYPQGLDFTTSVFGLYKNQTVSDNVLNGSLSPGSVYIDSEAMHGFFSYTSVYEKMQYQIRKERYENSRGVNLTASGINVFLPAAPKTFSEQWGVISRYHLVNWDSKITTAEIRVADLSRVRKWGGDGQYYFMPVGYSPYDKNSFYRNNANHIGEKFIRTNGRMFEDFGYVTVDTLIKTQNEHGYWSTSTLSDWLYKDYRIGAGYFDTRWDTEAAWSLLKGYRRFGEPQALEAASVFADFYCGFARTHSYKTRNGGLLVYDYGISSLPGIKTHVSLNHLVNEMNFLLEMYITTQNKVYFDVADKILTGIRDTGSSWINKATGDLYYGFFVNGSYGRVDYPTLTLNDLRYARNLIIKVYGKDEKIIDTLIQAKEKYLKAHNINF